MSTLYKYIAQEVNKPMEKKAFNPLLAPGGAAARTIKGAPAAAHYLTEWLPYLGAGGALTPEMGTGARVFDTGDPVSAIGNITGLSGALSDPGRVQEFMGKAPDEILTEDQMYNVNQKLANLWQKAQSGQMSADQFKQEVKKVAHFSGLDLMLGVNTETAADAMISSMGIYRPQNKGLRSSLGVDDTPNFLDIFKLSRGSVDPNSPLSERKGLASSILGGIANSPIMSANYREPLDVEGVSDARKSIGHWGLGGAFGGRIARGAAHDVLKIPYATYKGKPINLARGVGAAANKMGPKSWKMGDRLSKLLLRGDFGKTKGIAGLYAARKHAPQLQKYLNYKNFTGPMAPAASQAARKDALKAILKYRKGGLISPTREYRPGKLWSGLRWLSSGLKGYEAANVALDPKMRGKMLKINQRDKEMWGANKSGVASTLYHILRPAFAFTEMMPSMQGITGSQATKGLAADVAEGTKTWMGGKPTELPKDVDIQKIK